MDPVHTAQTIRMPASAEVCVDSMDRYAFGIPSVQVLEPTTSSNWRTNLPQYVLNGYFTRLAVTQILFNWNLPTIITDYNDTFYIYDDLAAITQAIILDPGWYTPDELATEIQTQLNATFSDYTCIYLNGNFIITNTDHDWAFDTFEAIPQQDVLTYQRSLITSGFLYGPQQGAITANTPYVGSVPTMLATRYIDMFSSYITKFQDVKDTTTAQGTSSFNCVIARIYPTGLNNVKVLDNAGTAGIVDGNTVITMEYNTPKYIMWNPREALANFDIQLRDEFGQLIPWSETQGCEYTLTMFASES